MWWGSQQMTKDLRIELVAASEKVLLRNLMQVYRHDLSEFTGEGPNQDGTFRVGGYFDAYWIEESRHPFKILLEEHLAGFALVRQWEDGTNSMAEFFILRNHRRGNSGRRAATWLFDHFPGNWHVGQDERNEPAQKFWRSVIGDYTGGEFSEEWSDSQPRGPVQLFESRNLG